MARAPPWGWESATVMGSEMVLVTARDSAMDSGTARAMETGSAKDSGSVTAAASEWVQVTVRARGMESEVLRPPLRRRCPQRAASRRLCPPRCRRLHPRHRPDLLSVGVPRRRPAAVQAMVPAPPCRHWLLRRQRPRSRSRVQCPARLRRSDRRARARPGLRIQQGHWPTPRSPRRRPRAARLPGELRKRTRTVAAPLPKRARKSLSFCLAPPSGRTKSTRRPRPIGLSQR